MGSGDLAQSDPGIGMERGGPADSKTEEEKARHRKVLRDAFFSLGQPSQKLSPAA